MTSTGENGEERVGLGRRIWRSIVRHPLKPRTDTDRRRLVLDTLVLHFRPVHVPRRTIRYTHTFGLGGMALVLVSLLTVTGVLMLFVYEPVPAAAHASVQQLMSGVTFGPLVRGIHHWSANLLVVVLGLHMLRVFLTWGFLGPRQFNWLVGLALLLAVLASSFTGYLLPWDQLSYWAGTIVTGMLAYVPWVGTTLQHAVRGGATVGGPTLTIFYALHTTLVPVLIIALAALHFWRVRKAGGVVMPRRHGVVPPDRPEKVLSLPNLFLKELAVGLILIALVVVLATAFPPSLGAPANAGMSPNPAKAPWYFVGFQELLLHFHPVLATTVIPLLALLGLALLPYLPYTGDPQGVWGASESGRRMAVAAALGAVLLTVAWILVDDLLLRHGSWLPGLPPIVGQGLLPAAVLLGLAAGFVLLLRRRLSGTLVETVQAAFVFTATAYLVLTIAGQWFRGAGMALIWPWGG